MAGADSDRIETAFLRFDISPETGRYEIKDTQGQVVWKSNPFHARFGEATFNVSGKSQRIPLDRCETKRLENGLELTFQPLAEKPETRLHVRVRPANNGKALEFAWAVSDALPLESIRLLDEALWVTDAEKGYVVVAGARGIVRAGRKRPGFHESHLLRGGDRLRNFLAQNLAVTLTQALHGGFDSGFGRSQTGADLGVSQRAGLARLEIFQRFKQRCFIYLDVFRREAIKRALQKCLHPSAFEDLLRSQFIHGLGKIPFFSLACIEREQRMAAAALLRSGLVALLGQEMLNKCEEKGTELATLMVKAGEIISL